MSPGPPRPYRSLSLWHDTAATTFVAACLRSTATSMSTWPSSAAGSPGLWTARYLADADPSLRIVVIEAEVCGFGASGRNGGWCSALLPTPEPEP